MQRGRALFDGMRCFPGKVEERGIIGGPDRTESATFANHGPCVSGCEGNSPGDRDHTGRIGCSGSERAGASFLKHGSSRE